MGEGFRSVEIAVDDRELLARFVEGRDEQAFSALVARHGRMALGVCRRILGASSEADDAFQATFLVLLARAGELHRGQKGVRSLGGWLHRVAANSALQLVRESKSRRRLEASFARNRPASSEENPMQEILPILDEELRRLPDRYRAPLVLCYLQDQTQHEAAEALGVSYATLRRRLERGRELLHGRLARRGCVIASAALAAVLVESAALADQLGPDVSATLACPLRHSTPAVPLGVGGISSRSVRLSRTVLRTLRNQAIRRSAGLLAVLILLLIGSTSFVNSDVNAADDQKPKADEPAPPARKVAPKPKPKPAPKPKAASKEAKSEAKKDAPRPEPARDPFEARNPAEQTNQAESNFRASISINGQTREFTDPVEYQQALQAMGFGFNNMNNVNPPPAANPPATPAKKSSAASKRRRSADARAARTPANAGAQPGFPGMTGFQFGAQFGTDVPGGFVGWSNTLPNMGIPGMGFPGMGLPGFNPAPGANRTPAAGGGGVDGFDNGVGAPAPAEPEAKAKNDKMEKAEDTGKVSKSGKSVGKGAN